MKVIICPDVAVPDDAPRPWVFLAGGITGCPDWQADLIELLVLADEAAPFDGTVISPRRADWDPDAGQAGIIAQIDWEYVEAVVWAFREPPEIVAQHPDREHFYRFRHDYSADDIREHMAEQWAKVYNRVPDQAMAMEMLHFVRSNGGCSVVRGPEWVQLSPALYEARMRPWGYDPLDG